jgi:hypothetical protein
MLRADREVRKVGYKSLFFVRSWTRAITCAS